MYNTTFFEYYRKAIKAKYEREKDADPSIELKAITTSKLKDLSMKRFKSNTDKNDLDAFLSFFEFEFDPAKKNLITGKTVDKLKPIRKFFLGITEEPTEETIEFAAVLLDFRPRPFYQFSKIMEGKSEDEIMQELANHYSKNNNEGSGELTNPESISLKEETSIVPETESKEPNNNSPVIGTEEPINKISFVDKIKKNKVSLIAMICLIVVAGYFIFFNKGCMQWSDNHYEVVDCKDGIEGNQNKIILYDSHLLDFKKIPVCDTTTWYANGESIVWYAKIKSEVDFFNSCGNGRHPETNSTLRPLTEYMFNKYKSKDCVSK